MVMILLSVDTKAQHNHIEESRLGQLHAPCAVVVARTELQLVNAGTVVVALEQRSIAAAIGVGRLAGYQPKPLGLHALEFDLDVAARTAMSGDQNVSSRTTHT